MPGTLYVIATPIGNLEDITFRAVRILRDAADVIACEDTRQTQKLLDHYGIRKPLLSYHDHNEAARTPELIERLLRGESVALASDAGTPLISDPGYRIVVSAIQSGVPVVPIPGASAILSALSACGLPTDQFRFIGFLPTKTMARRKALQELSGERASVVLYESPHRVLEALSDMAELLGTRRIVVARELTKIHEEFLRGSAAQIAALLAERGSVKGEITIVIGRSEELPVIHDPLSEIEKLQTEEGLDRMAAIKAVAKRMGLPKREIYRLFEERGSNLQDKHRG